MSTKHAAWGWTLAVLAGCGAGEPSTLIETGYACPQEAEQVEPAGWPVEEAAPAVAPADAPVESSPEPGTEDGSAPPGEDPGAEGDPAGAEGAGEEGEGDSAGDEGAGEDGEGDGAGEEGEGESGGSGFPQYQENSARSFDSGGRLGAGARDGGEGVCPGTLRPAPPSYPRAEFRPVSVRPGEVARLDASPSRAGPGEGIDAWHWTLPARPEGSAAWLSDADRPVASLHTDLPGTYLVRLLVESGGVPIGPVEHEVLAVEGLVLEASLRRSTLTAVAIALTGGLRLGIDGNQALVRQPAGGPPHQGIVVHSIDTTAAGVRLGPTAVCGPLIPLPQPTAVSVVVGLDEGLASDLVPGDEIELAVSAVGALTGDEWRGTLRYVVPDSYESALPAVSTRP